MKFLLPALIGLSVIGSAHAAEVSLLNGSPQEGKMNVQYQMLNSIGPVGKLMTTTLPNTITLPADITELRVISLTNPALPMKDHRFVFPEPGCKWEESSGKPAEIIFRISDHQISCH